MNGEGDGAQSGRIPGLENEEGSLLLLLWNLRMTEEMALAR